MRNAFTASNQPAQSPRCAYTYSPCPALPYLGGWTGTWGLMKSLERHDGVKKGEDFRRRPLDGLRFSRAWPASAAIVMRAALLVVSAKAALSGLRYLLCGVAEVVEKVLE